MFIWVCWKRHLKSPCVKGWLCVASHASSWVSSGWVSLAPALGRTGNPWPLRHTEQWVRLRARCFSPDVLGFVRLFSLARLPRFRGELNVACSVSFVKFAQLIFSFGGVVSWVTTMNMKASTLKNQGFPVLKSIAPNTPNVRWSKELAGWFSDLIWWLLVWQFG